MNSFHVLKPTTRTVDATIKALLVVAAACLAMSCARSYDGCEAALTVEAAQLSEEDWPEGLEEQIPAYEGLLGLWQAEYTCDDSVAHTVTAIIEGPSQEDLDIVLGPDEDLATKDEFVCAALAMAAGGITLFGTEDDAIEGVPAELSIELRPPGGVVIYAAGTGVSSADSGADSFSVGVQMDKASRISGTVTISPDLVQCTSETECEQTQRNCKLLYWSRPDYE